MHLQVRLPELPVEVWGPFVFVLADPAASERVQSVALQLAAVQVNKRCSLDLAVGLFCRGCVECLAGADSARHATVLQESFENSSGWNCGSSPWRSLKVT
jgi:hypothetical protein